MAATLASMLTRVRDLVADTGADLWTEAGLSEALRLALAEYGLAAQIDLPERAAVTLQGLDGALVTTLPAGHESLVVWGAAAYAAQGRAIERAGLHDQGAESKRLQGWGDARLGEFKATLVALFPGYRAALAGKEPDPRAAEAARLAGLRTSTNAPWATWEVKL